MRRRISQLLAISVLLLFNIVACSPYIEPLVRVPQVTLPSDLGTDRSASGAEIYLETIRDSRPTSVVASFKGVSVQFNEDIVPAVRLAIKEIFRLKGLSIRGSAPVVINAEVKQWSAVFVPEDSKKVDSHAEIYLEVIGPADKKIYSGTYRGFASFQGSPFDNKQLEEILRTAMDEAMKQLASDQGLMDTVTAF